MARQPTIDVDEKHVVNFNPLGVVVGETDGSTTSYVVDKATFSTPTAPAPATAPTAPTATTTLDASTEPPAAPAAVAVATTLPSEALLPRCSGRRKLMHYILM